MLFEILKNTDNRIDCPYSTGINLTLRIPPGAIGNNKETLNITKGNEYSQYPLPEMYKSTGIIFAIDKEILFNKVVDIEVSILGNPNIEELQNVPKLSDRKDLTLMFANDYESKKYFMSTYTYDAQKNTEYLRAKTIRLKNIVIAYFYSKFTSTTSDMTDSFASWMKIRNSKESNGQLLFNTFARQHDNIDAYITSYINNKFLLTAEVNKKNTVYYVPNIDDPIDRNVYGQITGNEPVKLTKARTEYELLNLPNRYFYDTVRKRLYFNEKFSKIIID